MPEKKRIVILGGGFAGVFTARRLLQRINRDPALAHVEVALVNTENYMVFQPMLAEVLSGNVGLIDTVSPIRKLVPGIQLYVREVDEVSLEKQIVVCAPGFKPRALNLQYDHLVIALGNVTDFRGLRGLAQHARPFKTLGDALSLRNHVLHALEEAAHETDAALRKQLLTFVVAGGGFSGIECIAEMQDFVRSIASAYRGIRLEDCRFVLIHSRDRILPEIDPKLGEYAIKLLRKRGIEFLLGQRLAAATGDEAILKDGSTIPTKTLVSTVPSHPSPIVEAMSDHLSPLGGINDRGKLLVDGHCNVIGTDNLWALGDCAMVPLPTKPGEEQKFAPPTAQHAVREATVCGDNIADTILSKPTRVFNFPGLGSMAALGHHRGVAQVMGFCITGIIAWFMWRTIYWTKMPGLGAKIRVGSSWLVSLFLPPDPVQLKLGSSNGVRQEHFEPGQNVFTQGDVGDRLYIIIKGKAQVLITDPQDPNSEEKTVAQLNTGEFFGEIALMHRIQRTATVRCIEQMDLLSIEKSDFSAMITNLDAMRDVFASKANARLASESTE